MKKAIFFFAFIFCLQNINAQESTFQDFLTKFPDSTLPYGIGAHTVRDLVYQKKATILAWEFYKFLPLIESSAQFFSMPVHPEPLLKFETDSNFILLYNLKIGAKINQTHYVVSVFTKKGKHIASHFIGGANYTEVVSFTIDEKLNAACSLFYVSDEGKLKPQDMQVIDLTKKGNPNQLFWEAAQKKVPAPTTASTDGK